jgi:hypothetical protein
MALSKTNSIPVKAARGATGLRPGKRYRRGFSGGNNGSI